MIRDEEEFEYFMTKIEHMMDFEVVVVMTSLSNRKTKKLICLESVHYDSGKTGRESPG